MFNNEQEIQKAERKHAIDRELHKMLSEAMLEMDIPEEQKMAVRVTDEIRDVLDAMHEVAPMRTLCGSFNIENAKKYIFFLHSVAAQIRAFGINNPLATEVEDA